MKKPDLINHPPHYSSHPSGIEVIRYARLLPFGPGSAVKYVMRRDHKDNPIENLRKAEWFLTDSLDNNVSYTLTSRLYNIIQMVLLHEPNELVREFLLALYVAPLGARLFFAEHPDIDRARELVRVLIDEYEERNR